MMDCCLRLGAIAAMLVTVGGCGGVFDSSVSGTVTLDGKVVPCRHGHVPSVRERPGRLRADPE